MSAQCPDDSVLDAFVRGALSAPELVALDAHLDRCDSCGELVAHLAHSHTRSTAAAPSHTAAREGEALGPYTLRAQIGEGASGQVFLGWDPRLGREVALKLLRPERAQDPVARERLLREAAALASLSHPNVVTVFDVGEHGETVYVAMEIVRGPTLREHCSERRSAESVVAIVRAIGAGLAAAHERGLLHRDVKPDNIIVGADRARLADFGLAGAVLAQPIESASLAPHTSLTLTGALLGTPLYMPPETLRGARATERSDLYSLAVTLYEALARRRPFEATSIDGLLAAIDRGAPKIPGVPPWLDRAVRDALAADPDRRPPSVRAWLDTLAPPKRTRIQPALLVFASIAALSLAARFAARPTAPSTQPARAALCAEETASAAILAPSRRAAILAGFVRANATVGDNAARLLFASVDRFTAHLRAARARSCQSAQQQSSPATAAMHSATMQCLDDARRTIEATIESFAQPDAAAVLRASAIDDELPTLDRCSDGRALLAREPAPTTAPRASAVASAEALVRRAVAEHAAGRYSAAADRATEAVNAATRAQWGPIESAARRALARALRALGRFEDAATQARRAALVAEASRDDDAAARAWIELVSDYGARGAWTDTARAIEQAQASVTRVGDPALRASLELLRAITATNTGALDEARAALERSERAVIERGADRSTVLTAKANLARQRGALDEALRLHEEARALDRARLGEDHPLTALHQHNTAGVLRRLARFDEAKTAYLQALGVERRWLGDGSVEAGLTQNSLGLLALESDRLDEAERWLLAARDALRGRSEEPLATLNLALLAIARRQHESAIALATEALARDTATFGAAHLRAARAAKVRAIALMGARRWAEAGRDLASARAALAGATDAESQMVRDECATHERTLAQRTRSLRPQRRHEQRSAVTSDTPAAVSIERRHSGPAPSGSGSYGPAQRWGP